jgi:hypothetical protein
METEVIAEVLGGRKVLGKAVRKPDDLARLGSLETACPPSPLSFLRSSSVSETAFLDRSSESVNARLPVGLVTPPD